MIASVYIKDGNIHLYNEGNNFSAIGGLAHELGKPLLDFVWYETEMFMDGFGAMLEAFDNELAYVGAKDPAFISLLKQQLAEMQQHEIYVFCYAQTLFDFIYAFIDSPWEAAVEFAKKYPPTGNRLRWVKGFEWANSNVPGVEVAHFADKEKRLFRAASEAVEIMHDHLRSFQKFIVHEIKVLLHYRKEIKVPDSRAIDYIDILDEYHKIQFGEDAEKYYIEKPFRTFYGRTATGVEQLYEIDSIEDLFRFEFIKMIEHEIFIKKCRNCERFFIPMRRVDAEYCNRVWGDTQRRCNEIGAMVQYEKRVAENPILEAHKKAYRRLNSRTRNKKMTQGEFLKWSEEASRKRDECSAGTLPFDEFVAWLEQGRIRKGKEINKN